MITKYKKYGESSSWYDTQLTIVFTKMVISKIKTWYITI